MATMMRGRCSVRLLFAAALAVAGPAAAQVVVQASTIDALFGRWNHTDSPGLALAVIRDGKIVYEKGYGMANLETGMPITSRTIFYIASDSKQFTAASIAILVEQGKVSLDDDVRRYVPELPDYGPKITIGHLIHHTSGLRDYLGLAALSGRDPADTFPKPVALDLVIRQKALNFKPGAEFLYSNTNYLLLSLIIERVTGKSLRAFAEEAIFAPLGMTRTQFYDDPKRIVADRAIGHTIGKDGQFRQFRTIFALTGDGGLLTNVEDLAKWDRNFYDNRLGKGGPALIDALQTRGILNDGTRIDYAFGLMISAYRGLPIVTHAGGFLGFTANIVRFPEQKLSIIILSNVQDSNPVKLSEAVADLYLNGQFPQAATATTAPPTPPAAAFAIPSAVQRGEFAGSYYSAELDSHYVLSVGAKGLAAMIGYGEPVDLAFSAKDVASGPFELRFTRDARGKLTGFVMNAGRVRGLRFVRRASRDEVVRKMKV